MSYKAGSWLAICDRCGMSFLSDKLKLTWDGLRVDAACWEERHPQEFVRAVKESTIPWARPEPQELNISPFDYVDSGYWDSPAIVPPALATTDMYVERDPIQDVNY